MLTESDFIDYLKTALTADIRHDAFFDPITRLALTQDLLIENTHFKRDWTTPEDLGWKAIAVNLSDLAATAAMPLWITVGLACPPETDAEWIKRLYAGMQDCCNQYGCQIVGGDTTRAETVILSIAATGCVPDEAAVGRRNGAKPGDVIAITNNHGLSGLGLHALKNNEKNFYPEGIKAHLRPRPLIELGQSTAKHYARLGQETFTLMDTSDGLADALIQLAKINQLDLKIDGNLIPLHSELMAYSQNNKSIALQLALYGGEDYGLCLILPEAIARAFPELSIIGTAEAALSHSTVTISLNGATQILDPSHTFQHF